MLHHTKAIVLRHTKYGESSMIVQLFTETLGTISIMAKGARSAKKNKTANLYQVGMLLDIVLFYHPNKNFQIINEVKVAYLYEAVTTSMIHNCLMQFSLECIQQVVKYDTPQEELFTLVYEYLIQLDKIDTALLANIPLYFLQLLIQNHGYRIEGEYQEQTPIFDLYQGKYVNHITAQTIYIDGDKAAVLSALNQCKSLLEVLELHILKSDRLYIMDVLIKYLQIHVPEFKQLKSLPILNTILN